MDINFPLSKCDRLLEQTDITLNLLQSSRSNPKLSAHAYMFGEFYFVATPLSPPGTKILAHIKPNQRYTLELNGEAGWYLGPPINHYRCVKYHFSCTKTTRDCNTATFPYHRPVP